MEINKDNFAEAIKTDEFKNVLMPLITETEGVKTIVTNKAEAIYKDRIDDEVKKIHTQYDDDMFDILGERPGSKDGTKQKTYDKMKELLTDLKELRGKKDSLTKEAEVQRLQGEIEKLKKEGGASHVQAIFDQAKLDWEKKENDYKEQIANSSKSNEDYKKRTEIQTGIQQIKFNPDTPESVKKMIIENVEKSLIESSKFENGKLIFVDKDGKPLLNSKYEPKSPTEMLMSLDAIKDIALKADDNKGGGGADPKIEGSIQTTSVDGKDTKKLILQEGSFKTKNEFQTVANKALMDAGISKSDENYLLLMDQAYKDYKVAELPIQ